ncbi:MAG: SDR family oxidoreductase [Gemmatimonadota bacterium]
MTILVTGATGQLGARVVESLLAKVPASLIAVSVRKPEKASALAARGVDVRQGDFDDPASLDRAFARVDRLLIISTDGDNETRIRQHLAAVAAAKRAGVKFIAYTSIAKADESTLWLAEVHRTTEQAIRDTGIPFTFLRNNWYLENDTGVIQGAAAGAPVVTSAGEGRVGWAPRDDYAQAAAAVLAGEGHENRIYELSGLPVTYADLAKAIGQALGREVPVRQVDDAGYRAAMAAAGVPETLLAFVVGVQQAIREGSLDVRSDDLPALLGRAVTPLTDAIARIVRG